MRLIVWRRCFFLVALIGLAATVSPALAAEPLSVTFKGGFTLTDLVRFGDTPTWIDLSGSPRGGFALGPSVRIDVPGRFALQIEALWVRRVVDLDMRFEVSCCGPRSIAIRTDHIELPILARFEFEAGGTRPYLLAGPSAAIKLGGRAAGSLFDYLTVAGFAPPPDFATALRSFDVALATGAGVDFGPPGTRGLVLEARASWSLRSLFDGGQADPLVGLATPHARTIFMMAGYRF